MKYWPKREEKEHINVLGLRVTKFAIMIFKNRENSSLKNGQYSGTYKPRDGGHSQQGLFRFGQENLGLSVYKWNHDYRGTFTEYS